MSILRFYDRWPQYNRRLTEVIGAMTDEQLAIRPSPERWPIWATVGHTAGVRPYWLSTVLGDRARRRRRSPISATTSAGRTTSTTHAALLSS
jgi:uncharacterized damage-inducible protein DinB